MCIVQKRSNTVETVHAVPDKSKSRESEESKSAFATFWLTDWKNCIQDDKAKKIWVVWGEKIPEDIL